ncbi:MAG: hypothetical protein Q7R40_00725 [Phaeospirillum sp.]|nr:hypothetical protein [Phaeospirillum sp.]
MNIRRLGHGGGTLRHHGDAARHGLGQGGVGGHGGDLLLPEIEITARKCVKIRRRF